MTSYFQDSYANLCLCYWLDTIDIAQIYLAASLLLKSVFLLGLAALSSVILKDEHQCLGL